HDPVELGEQGPLGRHVLDDALDDDVAVVEGLPAAGDDEAPEGGVAQLRGELALVDGPAQGFLDPAAGLVGRARGGLDEDGLEAAQRRHLRDPRTHEASSDDPDGLDVAHPAPPLVSRPARARTFATISSSVASCPKTSATPSSRSL